MENLFLNLLNISITAGYLVIAVLLLRPLLKKAPKYVRCILWGLVGVRLLFPFSVESVLSLIPSAQTVPQEILYSPQPQIHSGIPAINSMVNPVLSQSMAPTQTYSVNPMQVVVAVAWNVWLLGMVVMALYAIVSYLRLRHKLREAVRDSENIWQCDGIGSAFLLGIGKPRIYLPSDLCGESKDFVIAHEKAHLQRKDHWWKPLGYLLLTVYWFHPLMWVAYIFLCRDIEYACDEKVIKQLGVDCKKAYSEALIGCSIPRKMISACPVAFGEDGVKGRVKSILNYKKPAFWLIVIALVVCVAVAVCFLTVPPEKEEQNQEAVSFVATVTSLDEDFIFVEPVKAAYERSVADRFMISFADTTKIAVFVGDTVFITYDGKIDKTDPPQLPNVKHIRRIHGSASNYTQKVSYDIDHDGVPEACILDDGPTSGILSVDIQAQQNGVTEYYGLFGGPEWYDIFFWNENDGTVVLVAKRWINQSAVEEVKYDLSVLEDQIIFTEKSSQTIEIRDVSKVGPEYFHAQTKGDVDADGIIEDCYLTWETVSDYSNLYVSVYENGIQEHTTGRVVEIAEYSFKTLESGEIAIIGTLYQIPDAEVMYQLVMYEDSLVLWEGDEGIDTKCMRANIIKIEENSIVVVPGTGEDEASIANLFRVPVTYQQKRKLHLCDTVKILYDGQMDGANPAVLPNVYSVAVMAEYDRYAERSNADDHVQYDIDADGVKEDCFIDSELSGVFDLLVFAYEGEKREYFSVYLMEHQNYSFRTLDNGETVIVGKADTEGAKEQIFHLSVVDGQIVLQEEQ